jgi:hypothetical protein
MFEYIGKWQIAGGQSYFQFDEDGGYLYYNGTLFGGGYQIGNYLGNELQVLLTDTPEEIFIQGSPNPNAIFIKIINRGYKRYLRS